MHSTLRAIAVSVEEPKARQFAWVLMERDGAAWTELDRAGVVAATYRQAMAAGLLALQALVENLDIGPRVAPTEEDPDRNEASDRPPSGAEKGPFFGFGPAR